MEENIYHFTQCHTLAECNLRFPTFCGIHHYSLHDLPYKSHHTEITVPGV